MFYKIIKNFFLKKNVTKRLLKQKNQLVQQKIATVGLLVDETYFSNTAGLVEQLISQGIEKDKITDHFYDTGVYEIEWKFSKYWKTNHPFMGKMSFPENELKPSRTITATKIVSTINNTNNNYTDHNSNNNYTNHNSNNKFTNNNINKHYINHK
jgi:hypothetical protein